MDINSIIYMLESDDRIKLEIIDVSNRRFKIKIENINHLESVFYRLCNSIEKELNEILRRKVTKKFKLQRNENTFDSIYSCTFVLYNE